MDGDAGVKTHSNRGSGPSRGGQKPFAISVSERPDFRQLSSGPPALPASIVFGQEGTSHSSGLKRLAVVPRHPRRGVGSQFLGVPLQFGSCVVCSGKRADERLVLRSGRRFLAAALQPVEWPPNASRFVPLDPVRGLALERMTRSSRRHAHRHLPSRCARALRRVRRGAAGQSGTVEACTKHGWRKDFRCAHYQRSDRADGGQTED